MKKGLLGRAKGGIPSSIPRAESSSNRTKTWYIPSPTRNLERLPSSSSGYLSPPLERHRVSTFLSRRPTPKYPQYITLNVFRLFLPTSINQQRLTSSIIQKRNLTPKRDQPCLQSPRASTRKTKTKTETKRTISSSPQPNVTVTSSLPALPHHTTSSNVLIHLLSPANSPRNASPEVHPVSRDDIARCTIVLLVGGSPRSR